MNDFETAAGLAATDADFERQRRETQKQRNAEIQNTDLGYTMPQRVTLPDMLNDYVYVVRGKLVAHVTATRTGIIKQEEHQSLVKGSKMVVEDRDGKEKVTPIHDVWMTHANRQYVMTRTFAAGRDSICKDPNGESAINTWRPHIREPLPEEEYRHYITPFLEHVHYLFGDEYFAFLGWLAHLEQRPEVLPHYGWLHVADMTGTGRNWLASVLARVFIGYVAPNIEMSDLLNSNFNGQIAGKVLGICDEVQEGGTANYQAVNKLKSQVNCEMRYIKPKYGSEYIEFNSMRWLVFSNHLNALPINDADRRWRCVHFNAQPRDPAIYEQLYGLLEDAKFIQAVGWFLKTHDISKFRPGERPPLNEAKRKILQASKTPVQAQAEIVISRWPSDIIVSEDLANILSDGVARTPDKHMIHSMKELNAVSGPKAKVRGKGRNIWILRNADKWLSAPPAARAEEIERAYSTLPHGWNENRDPLAILAE
ncbi:hypothetical protein IIK97_004090 [Salmonella enterica subsp. enterica serovar Nigeria]|nr:hypothetical protein [Salmonella enterica subsp. enterica serovar Nigeria]